MAFNNLWICKYDENISYNQVKNNLKSNNYFIENYKTDIIDEHNSQSLNFVYGKYGYEYETNAAYPKITSERIIDEGDLIVKTSVISFWITDNHIILFSLKDEKISLQKIFLMEYLLLKILILTLLKFMKLFMKVNLEICGLLLLKIEIIMLIGVVYLV